MKTFIGHKNPGAERNGFCEPIFRGDDKELYCAEAVEDIICEFRPVPELASLYSPITFPITKDVNDPELLVFLLNSKVLIGDRAQLSKVLLDHIDELKPFPYHLRDVGTFLGDQSIIKRAQEHIDETIREDFQGYEVLDVESQTLENRFTFKEGLLSVNSELKMMKPIGKEELMIKMKMS